MVNKLESNGTTTASNRLKVLIVDDDQDCRSLLCDAIGELGGEHQIIECSNGRDAVEYLFQSDNAGKPDVVFTDLEMPLMGGLEMLEMIKSHPRLKSIPVVILSGVVDKEVMERAALLGANSYTVKPARVDQFMQTIFASVQYWLTVHRFPRREAENVQATF
jgi:two-component system, response regulator